MFKNVVALQGAASFVIQAKLAAFVRARSRDGLRVAGCIEEISGEAGAHCAGKTLRDLVSNRHYPIEQYLGPGSTSCRLDAAGVAGACVDAMTAIEHGCDLVVLAKFGKLEARRSGLLDAFAAAVARDIPVVTAVAPQFSDVWIDYTGDLASFIEPKELALEAWWRGLIDARSCLSEGPTSRLASFA